jgi:hypothetical protein
MVICGYAVHFVQKYHDTRRHGGDENVKRVSRFLDDDDRP